MILVMERQSIIFLKDGAWWNAPSVGDLEVKRDGDGYYTKGWGLQGHTVAGQYQFCLFQPDCWLCSFFSIFAISLWIGDREYDASDEKAMGTVAHFPEPGKGGVQIIKMEF